MINITSLAVGYMFYVAHFKVHIFKKEHCPDRKKTGYKQPVKNKNKKTPQQQRC